MEIRALRASDARAAFRCGDADLDRFLHKFAAQNQFRHHVGTTYVAEQAGRIVGYATVAAGHLEIDRLAAARRRRLPRYPLPILRLARLAVDVTFQAQGVGRQLLRFVLQLALRMAEDVGCVGVVVDSRPDAVGFYGRLGFEILEAATGGSHARPAPASMFLSVAEIRAARRSP